MPAVIAQEDFDTWLDVGGTSVKEAVALLRPAPEDFFEAVPVSQRVNSARDDDETLTEPVALQDAPPEAVSTATPQSKPAGRDAGQLDLF